MTTISPDVVTQVARLARLRLDDHAAAHVTQQLNDILAYVRQLQAVPTDGVEPTSHVLPLSNVLRPDESKPSLPQTSVIALAPATHPPFLAVPKVLEAG